MRKLFLLGLPLLSLALLVAADEKRTAEKWADERLKVADGLLLWLDASRQPAAWQAHGKPALADESALDVCYDASGNGLHFAQRVKDAQPRFVRAGEHSALRFDGKDDYLGLTGPKRALGEFTLILHAAPRSNTGGFRAFFAGNEAGKNDYTTGFTVDLNGGGSAALDNVNVEGKGFGGARDLLAGSYPFGGFHTFGVTCRPGPGGVRLSLDGKAAGKRDRAPGELRIDHLSLGARCYSNTPEPTHVSGFLEGDVAEVLLYNRVLSSDELKAVHNYLTKKHAGIDAALAAPREGVPLVRVADPPPVQMLVPGFTVRQLPVDLPNLNNVRYRHDGKLIALGYNGNVYVLSDSDGDSLEDKSELFWENKGHFRGPIGMALTPPGYKRGTGVFIPSKGKVSLLVDTDKDGKGDKEIIVATGWKEISQAVDAVGLALDKEGNVYFGLGTANFANGYLLDKDGKAHYDLKGERGTIQKVSPDFKKRETVCTGVRFTIGLAFNRRGDLFATDQEGATWLPNGNPFDELLHIRPGPHYGFPPRHPRHLPNVIDEPSVFDYGPQHQSTCGLFFNEPVNGGPTFGPKAWAGDALVCGESRGKLYRTELVHTPAGYVARTHLLACLNMLTVDSCVAPDGGLVVCVHSGPPDWGTGPTGKGKLYKITYTDKDHPQPLFARAAGPREVRVAFDRPLEVAHVQNLTREAVIEYGQHVRAGDRFEALHPPYAVVQRQGTEPRFRLPVLAAAVTPDRRTLILTTTAMPQAAYYALTLPGMGRPEKAAAGELPQHAAIDLGYDLCGVEARWKSDSWATGNPLWLPHLDPNVSRTFTEGSADHQPFWMGVKAEGVLTLRTKLDLSNMLRPAVQPGSALDYKPELERVTLFLSSKYPFTAKLGEAAAQDATLSRASKHTLALKAPADAKGPVPLELVLSKGAGAPELEVSFDTAEDNTRRALPLRRFLLPWAEMERSTEEVVRQPIPELKGGDWTRGRQVYFSDEAACAKCHRVRGQGGAIGPDLSNLVHRDYASVLRDIREPSAALNPDHITYAVTMLDGRVLTGVPRTADNGRIILGDNNGNEHVLARADIEELYASSVSLMPEGVEKQLGPEKMRDLLTFLLKPPLEPAPLERKGAPPPRKRAEVDAVLKKAERGRRGGVTPPLRIVLAAGPKDHGPGEHDYPLWQRRWYNLLSLAENVTVETINGWPPEKIWKTADVIVFYSANPNWVAGKAKQIDAFLARGGGLVYLHFAVNGGKDADALAKRIGLAWGGGARFRHGPLELAFPDPKHPITRGFEKVKFIDESYWNLTGDKKDIKVLGTAVEDGKPRPLLWTREQGKGRVFVSILGHYSWTFDDPLFRVLVLRGLAWSAGEPADRMIDLATVGARIAE